MAGHVYDGDNVNSIWSNAVDYSVGMLEDFTQLTNLKFGDRASGHRKGAYLWCAIGNSLNHPPRVIGGGLSDVVMNGLYIAISGLGPDDSHSGNPNLLRTSFTSMTRSASLSASPASIV